MLLKIRLLCFIFNFLLLNLPPRALSSLLHINQDKLINGDEQGTGNRTDQ